MDYLIRLVQVHGSFRKPEIEAIAEACGLNLEILSYADDSPCCLIRLDSESSARALIHRSVLGKAIYELWGVGTDYAALHADVRRRTSHLWAQYRTCSFRFYVQSYRGKRSGASQLQIIESFSYLGFRGAIQMADADAQFCVLEDWLRGATEPRRVYFGRWIPQTSAREAVNVYDLKKRDYIARTSMDSELALVTANMVLAGPGKVLYDPFVGTGSFPVACAHFGAVTLGSDIDGRTIRGADGVDLRANFRQYGLEGKWAGGFVADLTNSPVRRARWLDGIVCDPPYGIREGLRVLGQRDPEKGREPVLIDGKQAYLQPAYVPPKKPYSFVSMLDDILQFSASMLVDKGRLSLWMPTANDEMEEFPIPSHPALELVSVCIQPFNKWSRRLLTYRRLPDSETLQSSTIHPQKQTEIKGLRNADDLNPFRKRYFERFRSVAETEANGKGPYISRREDAASVGVQNVLSGV
ncbi:MAG: hypothetical protein M1816_002004 [Peltula sp. TS41687]|nr:MAG: hypothetical protein M1816_002004 [Peltula sp. TS41687]